MSDALSLSRLDLPEEIENAIDAYGAASWGDGAHDDTDPRSGIARSALTAAILSRLGEAEARREEAEKERDLLAYRVCEIHNDRARAVRRVEDRVNIALDDACQMSAILLMAGEMSRQERRTAQAVANGLAAKVRTALTEAGRLAMKDA